MTPLHSETEPQLRQDYLATMMRLALSSTAENFEASIHTALRRTTEFFKASRAYVYQMQENGALHLIAQWIAASAVDRNAAPSILPAAAISPWRDLLNDGFGTRVRAGERFPEPLAGTTWLIPMNGEAGLTGLIGIENASPASIDIEAENQFLGVVGELVQTTMRQLGGRKDQNAHVRRLIPYIEPTQVDAEPLQDPHCIFCELSAGGRVMRMDAAAPEIDIGPANAEARMMIEEVFSSELTHEIRQAIRDVDTNGPIQARRFELKAAKGIRKYDLSVACLHRDSGDEGPRYQVILREAGSRIPPPDASKHLSRIVEMITNLTTIVDTEQRIVWTNTAFEEQTGYALRNIRGLDLSDLLIGEASNRETVRNVRRAISEGKPFEGENINYDAAGTPYWVTFNMQPLKDTTGQLSGFVFVETVITKSRELESTLRAERDFLAAITETGISAIIACNSAGECVFANDEARRLLQTETSGTFPPARDWPLAPLSDDAATAPYSALSQVMESGAKIRNMIMALNMPGKAQRVLSINASPLTEAASNARMLIIMTDISLQYEAEEVKRRAAAKALHDAEYDKLSGLPNHPHMKRLLASAMTESSQAPSELYFAIIDLDRFKQIKTVLGYDLGDDLVRATAARLRKIARKDMVIARFGDDSFACFFRKPQNEAKDLLNQICLAITEPFDLHDTTIFITASIGVTTHNSAEASPQALIRQAGMANDSAKSAGGNRYILYTQTMDAQFSRRSAVLQAMRHALQSDQFELAFQPKFSLSDGFALVGTEALLRWNSPALGRVSPAEFIPIADAAGLISEIDFHVLGMFARQLGSWLRDGFEVKASVNLSPQSFENPTLAPHLLELISTHGVPFSNVIIEITETSLVSSSQNAFHNIDQFRQAGIRLSIDDFGTGYSSLSYLQRLIVSEIKIDKSFIEGLGRADGAEDSETIVRAILKLANSFGLRCVAEGVENMAQLRWLKAEGCHTIQGYLSGKPMPPETFAATAYRRGASLNPTGKSGA
ncbi:EAL domain-containing protein [Thioclava sp. ES.031]|uniref:sensor domain-containing protein n=1 Tax=Thioclava sp. ES.031 TaxID=1798203 RepID=UPI000BF8C83F|nr:EAL domain-containing protein [Thioclava sp. ES.031]